MKFENAPAPFLVETDSKIKYTGLCVNCENRKECKIRNMEYVIWHCEEYL